MRALLLGLSRGLEADRAPGERIDPGVRGDPERSAWQLLYVTLCHPWHDIRMDPASDIRSTRWDVKRVNTL
jgi:hypothetical protein